MCIRDSVTGNPRYLKLAKYFIDVRGTRPGGDDYHQSRIPPVDQTEAIGHAVRAGYLYSGMADIAALTGDPQYVGAIDKIWENAVGKKLYPVSYTHLRRSARHSCAAWRKPDGRSATR